MGGESRKEGGERQPRRGGRGGRSGEQMSVFSLSHHFRFLASYHLHSTKRLIQAVEEHFPPTTTEGGDEDFFNKDAQLYFKSIHGTMAHLLGGDQIWWIRITGEEDPASMASIVPIYSLEPPSAIGEAWMARSPNRAKLFEALLHQCQKWVDLLKDKGDDWISTTISYADTSGVETSLVRASGLTQVFNHGTHHRGQISAAFSRWHKFNECPSFDFQSMGNHFLNYSIAAGSTCGKEEPRHGVEQGYDSVYERATPEIYDMGSNIL